MSQSQYARELVKKFGLKTSKRSRTPMSTTTKLSKDTFEIFLTKNLQEYDRKLVIPHYKSS